MTLLSYAVPGKAPGKVPVHFFGTQEFAWMRRSDVVAFGAGLDFGMHLCKASNRAKAAFRKALHEVSVYFLVSLPAKLPVLRPKGTVVRHACPCSLSTRLVSEGKLMYVAHTRILIAQYQHVSSTCTCASYVCGIRWA